MKESPKALARAAVRIVFNRFWIVAMLCHLLAAHAWPADRQILQGHVPAAVRRLAPVGRLEDSKRLKLAIGLPLRNQQELAKFLHDLSDPSSVNYRQYLTPAQFAERFGPAEKDYQAVVQFAKAHGLTVTATHPNRVVLDVEAAVPDIENALHVTMRLYQHPAEARQFYAPDREPSLDLATPVLHISGLNNYSLRHPNLKKKPAGQTAKASADTGSAPGGGYAGGDFRAAYVPGVALTGSGQCVGLLELDDYFDTDITTYTTEFNLPGVPLVRVPVDGGTSPTDSGNGEVSGDIEMLVSMAPGLSTIYVYEEPNDSPWDDIISQMADDNLAKQLSCSWGGGDRDATAEQLFQQMAAQGQSFFDAVGDSDAFTGDIPFPGDSPNITQAGATTLTTSGAGGSYVSETVWNWTNDGDDGVGSSGGVSTYYSIPAWQADISSITTAQGSKTKRNVPDISMVGDNIYTTYHDISHRGSTATSGLSGGTSYAAPLWAAFTALVNQQTASCGQQPVGFLNPAIYTLGKSARYNSVFHDTTTGNNYWSESPTNFSAVAGYDLCTGWGTPAGIALINALANSPPTATTGSATGTVYYRTTLNGTVNPNGLATTCYFQYGLTGAYGNTTVAQPAGSGTTAAPFSATLIGLSATTLYHYQFVAANSSGTTYGADQTFTTPNNPQPTVTTGSATKTAYNGTTLNGTVNPNGLTTSCSFQYGLTGAYGYTTAAQTIGSGSSAASFSESITGLTGATTYHYQLVAANGSGTASGSDGVFTTPNPPPPITGQATPLDSGVETLNVSLEGYGAGMVFFQYGLTQANGSGTTTLLPVASDSGAQTLTGTAAGLAPATRYYYRAAVSNGSRTEYGAEKFFITPPTFPLTTVATHGGMPLGIPDTKFISFGTPAINDSDTAAFRAVVSGTAAKAPSYSAIFLVTSGTGVATEITNNLRAAPDQSGSLGITGNFATLGDPVLNNNGDIAFLGALKNGGSVTSGNDQGIWATTSGALCLVARKGQPIAAAGVKVASFVQLALPDNGGPVFLANLTTEPGQVPSGTSQGIVSSGSTGELELLVRTGQPLAGGTVASLSIFAQPAGVTGQTRSFDSAGDLIFTAIFTNRTQGVYTIAPDGTVSQVSQTSGSAPISPDSATFATFDSPIINGTGDAAFQATISGTATTANSESGIWAESGTEGTLALVARRGVMVSYTQETGAGQTTVTGTFTALGQPVFNANDQVAFIGTVETGTGKNTARTEGIWTTGTSSLGLSLVAGTQEQAPDCKGAKFNSFGELVLPDTGGAVFVANLAGTGVTTANNQGLFAVDTTGQLNLVARKGDLLAIDSIGTTKTVASLSIFTASAGAAGQTRSFNSAGHLIYKVTFTDSTECIYTVAVSP